MNQFVIAPLLVALCTAIVTLLTRRFGRAQRALSVLGAVGYVAAVAWLITAVYPAGDPAVYHLGDWVAPYGIVLVADSLSAFMLAISAVVTLPALVYATRHVSAFGQKVSFHPLFHLMVVGVTGSFLTGDIFNLFVWFEVMLLSSYVLVVFYAGPEQTTATLRYVVLNLVGSAVMLLAIGGLYAATGTLNMADMAHRLANAQQYGVHVTPVLGLTALLFAVFMVKAGAVPFHWWVPDAYAAAPAPVSAVLAGVVKKVGVYAVIRLYFTVFAAAPLTDLAVPGDTVLGFFGIVLLAMAVLSMLFGGLAAVGQRDLDRLLAYSSIGQVGFILVALAAAALRPEFAAVGITAALVYSLTHGLAKGLLFLLAGVVEDATGTIRLDELGGLARTSPVVAGAFLLGGLGLVGIPPLVGFFGKFLVFDALARADVVVGLAAALVGAILTVAYVSSAWNRGFWGEPSAAVEGWDADSVQVACVVVLALGVVAAGVGFSPILEFARAGADAAIDRSAYINAVLERGGGAA
ncbi:complex I subunit 5 family protein [Salarchaeum japonicum]|uniref:complex I subunit 5 family protein n=1 Tax=Salarchaeum japonicum TaxID=555573 RepID=UPI003C72AB88